MCQTVLAEPGENGFQLSHFGTNAATSARGEKLLLTLDKEPASRHPRLTSATPQTSSSPVRSLLLCLPGFFKGDLKPQQHCVENTMSSSS